MQRILISAGALALVLLAGCRVESYKVDFAGAKKKVIVVSVDAGCVHVAVERGHGVVSGQLSNHNLTVLRFPRSQPVVSDDWETYIYNSPVPAGAYHLHLEASFKLTGSEAIRVMSGNDLCQK